MSTKPQRAPSSMSMRYGQVLHILETWKSSVRRALQCPGTLFAPPDAQAITVAVFCKLLIPSESRRCRMFWTLWTPRIQRTMPCSTRTMSWTEMRACCPSSALLRKPPAYTAQVTQLLVLSVLSVQCWAVRRLRACAPSHCFPVHPSKLCIFAEHLASSTCSAWLFPFSGIIEYPQRWLAPVGVK